MPSHFKKTLKKQFKKHTEAASGYCAREETFPKPRIKPLNSFSPVHRKRFDSIEVDLVLPKFELMTKTS